MNWYKISENVPNRPIPDAARPTRNTEYILEYHLEYVTDRSDKMYVIRVYKYPVGHPANMTNSAIFSVIAYNGPRRMGLSLIQQPKGMYDNIHVALEQARKLKNEKISSGYVLSNEPVSKLFNTGIRTEISLTPTPAPGPTPVVPRSPLSPYVHMSIEDVKNGNPEELNKAMYSTDTPRFIKRIIIEYDKLTPQMISDFVFSDYAKKEAAEEEGGEYSLREMILLNDKTTPEVYGRILREEFEKDNLSTIAATNIKTPPEDLAWVMEQGINNETSRLVFNNMNTPLLSIVKWLVVTNKTGEVSLSFVKVLVNYLKSNPFNTDGIKNITHLLHNMTSYKNLLHPSMLNDTGDLIEIIMSKSDTETINYLLQNFPKDFFDNIAMTPQHRQTIENHFASKKEENLDIDDVFAKNKTWFQKINNLSIQRETHKINNKKYSQQNYYYNIETAENPNTPPDILRKILERGNNNWVSCFAALNPNCPSDILKMILERGKNDGVSQYAALNPNCPKDVLKKILEKGKKDMVSQYAAENPNCPPDIMIKWMQDTGKIKKEDPKKHIIEKVEEENNVDEDLEKLKQLISKNNNIKKYSQQTWFQKINNLSIQREIKKETKNIRKNRH